MALDFPASPTNGQVYDKWTWDGTTWELTPTAGSDPALYVAKVGDTMTGPLVMGVGGPSLSNQSQYGGFRVQSPGDSAMEVKANGGRAYYSWYGGTDGARRGYLGYPDVATNQSTLATDGKLVIQPTHLLIYTDGYCDIQAPNQVIYHNAVGHVFRNSNGTANYGTFDANGLLVHVNLRVLGQMYNDGTGYWLTETTDQDTGIHYWGDGAVGLVSNGVGCIRAVVGGGASGAQFGNFGYGREGAQDTSNFTTGGTTTWGTSAVLITNASGSGNAQMAFHVGSQAPIIKTWSGAEVIQCRNNADNSFIPIHASAFTVNSSRATKLNIDYLDDAAVLARVRPAKQIRFRPAIRPLDAIVTEDYEYTGIDHVCGEGRCTGTIDDPCVKTLNDRDKIGLVAEDVYEFFPEAVDLDENGQPAGIDVAQVATASFAAVGALTRKVEELEAQIAILMAA